MAEGKEERIEGEGREEGNNEITTQLMHLQSIVNADHLCSSSHIRILSCPRLGVLFLLLSALLFPHVVWSRRDYVNGVDFASLKLATTPLDEEAAKATMVNLLRVLPDENDVVNEKTPLCYADKDVNGQQALVFTIDDTMRMNDEANQRVWAEVSPRRIEE